MEQFIDPVEWSENAWSSHLLKLRKSRKGQCTDGKETE